MSVQPFFADGLRFSCKRCSSCCRHESGFVYLSENDLSRLANKFKMEYTSFIQTWCRWVAFDQGVGRHQDAGRRYERLALKEKSTFDCIFWNNGCTVYDSRPLQCRAFPFWDAVVSSTEAWETTGRGCPGINNGELRTRGEIEQFLRQMGEELVIERYT